MKMKKSLLSVAVAAGVAASAQAQMYLNPEGTGEVLLYPVYTVENGNVTAMHIVNTTGDAKAVKVRFLEGKNSKEVLDFNLYLSPYDHFAFGTVLTADGLAAVTTTDNSCTVPELGTANGAYSGTKVVDGDVTIRTQPFVNYAYLADADATDARAWMGHVEVIEMGIIDGNATSIAGSDPDQTDANLGAAKAVLAGLTHGEDGVPADCAVVRAQWATGGYWKSDPSNPAKGAQFGMNNATGGLYGFGYVLNVADAAAFGFDAQAIASFQDQNAASLHTSPGSLQPSLGSGVTSAHNVDLTGAAPAYATVTWPGKVQAVSSLFMTASISNDVIVDPIVAAETDWVITFPTKNPHTNGATAPILPFTSKYTGKPEKLACETVEVNEWSREEVFTPIVEEGFSPLPPGQQSTKPSLCYETQVVSWNGMSALNVRSSTDKGYRYDIDFDYDNGWARIDFDTSMNYMAGSNLTLGGLPVIGFAATKYSNGDRSYGHSTEHKTEVTGSTVAATP